MCFAVLADHKVKIKENKKRTKYLDLAIELRKRWNMRVTVISHVIGALGMAPQILEKGVEEFEIRMTRNHPYYNIAEIGPNTEKSL